MIPGDTTFAKITCVNVDIYVRLQSYSHKLSV